MVKHRCGEADLRGPTASDPVYVLDARQVLGSCPLIFVTALYKDGLYANCEARICATTVFAVICTQFSKVIPSLLFRICQSALSQCSNWHAL